MEYRSFARTNWRVSVLSFGCMRFADEENAAAAIRTALDMGVNYLDVAPLYGNGTAEKYTGLGIKGRRDKGIVTAKSSPGNGGDQVREDWDPAAGFGVRTADQARAQIERSMKNLGVDHLDAYHLWSCHAPAIFDEAMKPGGFLDGVKKARGEGLLDYIGITGHDTAENLIRYLETGEFDILTMPFHAGDISRLPAAEYCLQNGIGLIAMNPLGGGGFAKKVKLWDRTASEIGVPSMLEAVLRFSISWPGITAALCGMTYPWQVEQNVAAVAPGPLPAEQRDALHSRLQEILRNVRHFCTGCGYCGECPQGIAIPEVLEVYMNYLVPGLRAEALPVIKARKGDARFDPAACTACKQCEAKCPNRIPVSDLMAAAAKEFGQA